MQLDSIKVDSLWVPMPVKKLVIGIKSHKMAPTATVQSISWQDNPAGVAPRAPDLCSHYLLWRHQERRLIASISHIARHSRGLGRPAK